MPVFERILNRSKVLEKALDGTWLRNEAIAENMANVDTPGYKSKTVNFESYLQEAMDPNSLKGFRSDPRHIPIGESDIDEIQPTVSQNYKDLEYRLDGNNVDFESEAAAAAKNTISYYTLIQSLNSHYKRILSSITEGRR